MAFNRKRNRNGESLEAAQVVIQSQHVKLTPIFREVKDDKGKVTSKETILIYKDRTSVSPIGQWFAAEWLDVNGQVNRKSVVSRSIELAPAKTQFKNGRTQRFIYSELYEKPEGGAFEFRLEADMDEQCVSRMNKRGQDGYIYDKGFQLMDLETFMATQDETAKNRTENENRLKALDPALRRQEFQDAHADVLKSNAAVSAQVAKFMAQQKGA